MRTKKFKAVSVATGAILIFVAPLVICGGCLNVSLESGSSTIVGVSFFLEVVSLIAGIMLFIRGKQHE